MKNKIILIAMLLFITTSLFAQVNILEMHFENHSTNGQALNIALNNHNNFPYRDTKAELVIRINVTDVSIPAFSFFTVTFPNPNILSLDTTGNNPDGVYTAPAGITRAATQLPSVAEPYALMRFDFSSPMPRLGFYEVRINVYATDAGMANIAASAALTVGGNSPADVTTSITVANQVLPVELGFFTAKIFDASKGQLYWNTLSEKNTKEFIVEKSMDATHWYYLGTQASKSENGRSQWNLDYDFLDPKLVNGNNFYRIKMIDYDDSFDYSPVRKLWYEAINEVEVYPNPAQNLLFVKGMESNTDVQIIDVTGRHIKLAITNVENDATIDVSSLSGGTYLLVLTKDNVVFKRQISIIR